MATSHTEPWLAALRPLVLEHAITRLLPSASIAPPPRPPTRTPAPVQLLPSLAAWLHHAFFRSQLRIHLEEQVWLGHGEVLQGITCGCAGAFDFCGLLCFKPKGPVI